jgi:replicative DNA helicase
MERENIELLEEFWTVLETPDYLQDLSEEDKIKKQEEISKVIRNLKTDATEQPFV